MHATRSSFRPNWETIWCWTVGQRQPRMGQTVRFNLMEAHQSRGLKLVRRMYPEDHQRSGPLRGHHRLPTARTRRSTALRVGRQWPFRVATVWTFCSMTVQLSNEVTLQRAHKAARSAPARAQRLSEPSWQLLSAWQPSRWAAVASRRSRRPTRLHAALRWLSLRPPSPLPPPCRWAAPRPPPQPPPPRPAASHSRLRRRLPRVALQTLTAGAERRPRPRRPPLGAPS